MKSLCCQNDQCLKNLTTTDYQILEDDDRRLYIFCSDCAELPWPMSQVTETIEVCEFGDCENRSTKYGFDGRPVCEYHYNVMNGTS